jgi:hypothetical protein
MKRSTRIGTIADTLECDLKSHPFPRPDPALLDRLRFLCVKLEDVDEYALEQATQLFSHADAYYGSRLAQNAPPNSDALFDEMLGFVDRMRVRAMVRAAQPGTDEM